MIWNLLIISMCLQSEAVLLQIRPYICREATDNCQYGSAKCTMSADLVEAQSILLLTCPASPFIFHKLQTTSQSVTRLILHPLSIVPTCEKLLSQSLPLVTMSCVTALTAQ